MPRLSVLILGLFALSLVACGDDGGSTTSGTGGQQGGGAAGSGTAGSDASAGTAGSGTAGSNTEGGAAGTSTAGAGGDSAGAGGSDAGAGGSDAGAGGSATEGGSGGSETAGAAGSDGGSAGNQAGGAAGGGTIPTTCEEAHGDPGCCVGDTVYWFDAAGLQEEDCTVDGAHCGWRDDIEIYACVLDAPTADPTGTYPLTCGGAPIAGLCDGGAGGAGGSGGSGGTSGSGGTGGSSDAPATCSDAHGSTGCCVGNTVYWFSAGKIKNIDCALDGNNCGWIASGSVYGCIAADPTADPSGTYPLACGAPAVPGACP